MSCAANPPAPAGYRVWRGAVPAELTAWAIGIRDHIAPYPFGQTWSKPYNGQTVLARCDCHSWTYRNGQLITGLAIKGVTLYSPLPSGSSFAEGAQSTAGDPLVTPDPTMALFDPPESGPNWALVAFSATAIALVIAGFVVVVRTRISDRA